MNSCYNIPLEQRGVQQLVAQFNAEEQLWQQLGNNRRRRRKLCPQMPTELQRQLDLPDFVAARPAQDCVGFWQVKTETSK